MSSEIVALVLGVGKRVGAGVVKKLSEAGYLVVIVSRSGSSDVNQKSIKADLSDPKNLEGVFREVRQKYGEPQIVVYNAYGFTPAPADDPFSTDPAIFAKDLSTNTASLYAAIQEALKSFKTLGKGTFIYTGNFLNTGIVVPPLLGLGVGKSGSAYLIATAATLYGPKGYKFYYADERKPDGQAKGEVDGDAHGDFYVQLIQDPVQKPWQATFVAGSGYTKF